MSVELWWGSGSTPAWRVQLALAHKRIAHTAHLLSFDKGETRTPEMLALNPRGKVPVLRDGDVVLNESLAILAYLDRAYPEPPLLGRTPAETGQVWRFVMEHESMGALAVHHLARPIFKGEADAATAHAALPALVAELDLLAARVGSGFLVGDAVSAADLVWYCAVRIVDRAITRPGAAGFELGLAPLGARWPALLPWAANVEAIPGFDATVPPHWIEGATASPARLR
jgi:glutathione S-transferase